MRCADFDNGNPSGGMPPEARGLVTYFNAGCNRAGQVFRAVLDSRQPMKSRLRHFGTSKETRSSIEERGAFLLPVVAERRGLP